MVASEEQRWAVVTRMNMSPQPTIRALAKEMGLSRQAVTRCWKHYRSTGGVKIKTREACKPSLSPAVVKAIKKAASKPELQSSARIAAAVRQEKGVAVSARSARRALKKEKWTYGQPSKMLKLSAKQVANRLKWSKENTRTSWGGVMFTDSKIFLREPTTAAARWYPKGQRPGRPVPSWSDKLHVYGGVTKLGKTKLYFVTGTSRQKSSFIDSKTGKPHAGVCAKEFMGVARHMAADAKKLFMQTPFATKWTFQLDNARCHTTAEVKDLLKEVSPRVMEFWPPNSPDLSWIENVWGWMQREIVKLPQAKDLESFKAQLQEVWDSLGVDMLKKFVEGMPQRVQQCRAAGGEQIRV